MRALTSLQEKPRTAQASGTVSHGLLNDSASRTGGRPLSPIERGYFEPRFGCDFGKIRVHADSSAANQATSLGARAFTQNNDIVFAPGQYETTTRAGRFLMAHELAHTIQQGRATGNSSVPSIQCRDFVPWPGQRGEDVADTRETDGDILREQVQRTGDPTYASPGPSLLEFNTRTCRLTVRKEINFVRAGSGENQLSPEAFAELKQRILDIANEYLNGWVLIGVTPGEGCTLSCPGGRIEVSVITSEGSGSYASTLNLHPTFGRENAGNIGANASDYTIWHEVGHIVLGAADEYYEEDRPDGTPRPEERVNESDWSVMAGEANMRRGILHPRQFSHLPAWLERRFPNCAFRLEAAPRPIVVEITPSLLVGALVAPQGESAAHYSIGVDLGIPLDRLRQLELVLGPRLNLLLGGDERSLLLGFRAGLEGQTGSTGGRMGVFIEGGGVGVTDLREGEFGAIPYVEGGGTAGYSFNGILNVAGEAAIGSRWTPGEEEGSDLERNPYFRLGVNLGASF